MAKINQTRECLSCGGIFDTVLRDGTDYYHSCPQFKVVGDPAVKQPIANRRDENIVEGPEVEDATTKTTRITTTVKSAGSGTKAGVRPAPIPE